jgi:hypothetical protein
MSEEKPAEGEEKKVPEFKAPNSQEEFDRMVADRLTRERAKFADYDDLKAKATKFDEVEQASKSELEREREARTAAEKERDSVKVEALRVTVAAEKGLTPAQAKRLVGATREDLEKDADELLAEFSTKKKPPPTATSLSSGSAPETRTEEKGRAAAAVRALRQG